MPPSSNISGGASGLLQRQSEGIRQMLYFNGNNTQTYGLKSNSGVSAGEPSWKVLIYDEVGQSILTPLFNVKELRDAGVTLNILLHSERDPVPDVPAIYFCQPTDKNIQRIGQDLQNGLYGSYHFNFVSPISRQKLEDLASLAIQANATTQIAKVFDQYVNFISLENEMFTLKKGGGQDILEASYYSLNRCELTDTEMEALLSQVVDGLFAVCVTLGTVPIIRCPKGNAAEAVAVRLDKKLRENLKDTRNSLFLNDGGIQGGQLSFYRPLLVILDRQVDLATPLHHTWTYQALAHDVLQYHLNSVSISETTNSDMNTGVQSKQKTRKCDLDNKDTFWVINKGAPFPQVAERIQQELEEYRLKEDDIKRMKKDMGVEGSTSENDAALGMHLSDTTQKLTSAVSSLPALLEKKRLIDMHTSLATAMLDQIKLRKLDVFFELEEKILSRQALDRSLMQIFEDQDAGTPEDKTRLFLIYYLCTPNISDSQIDEYTKTLQDMGCDLAPLQYLKRWKSLNQMTSNNGAPDYGASGGGTIKSVSMFTNLMAQSSKFVVEGVKNLVVKRHNLPVTKIVEELMEVKQGQYQEEYRYFDPKILRGQDNIPRAKNPFQEAIVFMVGGGNYIEYQNLMDHQQNKQQGATSSALSPAAGLVQGNPLQGQKRIIYGCSTLNNANQMMQQLAKLGHEM